jgi:hypothetical protein
MGEIGSLFESVLNQAKFYKSTGSPQMDVRKDRLRASRSYFKRVLVEEGLDATFSADSGGDLTNIAPIAFLRIFDPNHSPKATSGYYVVYLFAADGSSVFACLGHGTSYYDERGFKPSKDIEGIKARSSTARTKLEAWSTRLVREGATDIDLGLENLNLSRNSLLRAKNYEYGTIYAYEYKNGQMPSDDEIKEDLDEMLTLLLVLQGETEAIIREVSERPSPVVAKKKSQGGSRGQGRQLDPETRKAIELAAEDLVISYYENLGWNVERVGHLKWGFDILCKKGDDELHVEVKGTTGLGHEVILTPNEVEHAKSYPTVALGIVSGIKVAVDKSIETPGELTLLDPWVLDESRLIPSEFVYRR